MQGAIIPTLLIALLVSGCAITQPKAVTEADAVSSCRFIERNLTVKWADRSYWCVPQR